MAKSKQIRLIYTQARTAEITVPIGEELKIFRFENSMCIVTAKEFEEIKKHPAFKAGVIKKQVQIAVKREEWVTEGKKAPERTINDAKKPAVVCEICGEEFDSIEELNKHVEMKHTTTVNPELTKPTVRRNNRNK